MEPIATGNGNHFAAGDGYRISRFDGVVGTRAGMLPLHLPGEAFTTGFSFSWSLPVSENNIVSVGGDDLSPAYAAAMARRLQSSDLQGTVRVDAVRGSCLWIAPQFADCRGMSVDTAHARFTARLVRHDGYVAVTDDDTDFPALGVRVGDRVFNLARAAAGLVVEARPDSPHTIRIGNRPGHGEFTAVAGDLLRLQVAAREYVNRAEPGTIAGNSVCVPGADLSFLAAGDSVVNLSDPGAVGEVMERHAEAGRDCFRYTLLRGGTMPRITAGQYFKLLYDFVDSRRYTFVIRMRGEFVTANDTGIRRRSVCVGYPPGCSGQPVPAVLAADTALPVVTIDDYDAAGRRLGGGSLTIPATDVSPAPRGSMLVADMNLALSVEGGDLPDWFTRQRWHQYIFAAHGDGLGPGESNACDGVGVCFVAARRSPGAGTRTGVELVVLSAGTDLAHQDRARAVIDAYLEGGIALYDDHVFSYGPVSVRFNDRISMTPQ